MSRKSKALEFIQEGYNISVTGRNVLVTDPMKDYAIDKISKIERFSTRIVDVVVTMDIQRYVQRVDVVLSVDHIKIKASASTENMYASIDKVVDKIESQLRRYKKRINEHQAKSVETTEMRVNIFEPIDQEDVMDINDEIDEENLRREGERYRVPSIVKQETRPLKVLTFDEALMMIDLSSDPFLIFRNEANRKLCVIYRRDNENYGIIEAEG